jgi:cytochrome b pre-mRNA-processing protein 3
MKINKLFSPRPAVLAGKSLYASAASQARTPALFTTLGAADTVEGRFEVLTLHVALLLRRLKGQGAQGAETAQAVFDAYVRGLDDALRDMGVGDLSVGKKMRRLGEAFFGRVKNYDEALAALPDRAPLEAVLARTVLQGAAEGAGPYADYALAVMADLERQPLQTLLEGDVSWPLNL